MVVAVIDDHRILGLLSGATAPRGRYATTCSWWWRLTSAFAGNRGGALTRRLERLDPAISSALRRALRSLPDHLEIVELRRLIPAMGALAETLELDLVSAEAIAAAAYLGTGIEVQVDSPPLRAAARSSGVEYRVGPSA
jgi:hypothetical protein